MRHVDKPVRGFLDDLGSSAPTPGGGSAAALASAAGVSLLLMVAGMPKTRSGSEDEKTALASEATLLAAIRAHLIEAIDDDAAAFDRVVAAYKLPKGSADEQQARTAAIQGALRQAADQPLRVVEWSMQALQRAEVIAAHGNRAALSDVGTAVALLRAGLHGARLNVEINLGSIRDEAYNASARGNLERFAGAAAAGAEAAERLLRRDA